MPAEQNKHYNNTVNDLNSYLALFENLYKKILSNLMWKNWFNIKQPFMIAALFLTAFKITKTNVYNVWAFFINQEAIPFVCHQLRGHANDKLTDNRALHY